MTTFTTIIKIVAALTFISGGAALAENNPPVVIPPTIQDGGDITNTLTGGNSSSTSTGVGVGVGVGTGGNATTGPVNVTTGPTTATGGQGGAGGSIGDTTVNNTNKTRIKHAASTAAPVMMGGYGPGNCFGDTNPSGQFGASIQTFGWGVTANSSKASNICAMVAIAGPKAALSYLANVDPNVRRALLANGLAEKPSQRKARLAAEAEDAPTKNARPSQTVRCPEGSTWDGKGCWAKNIKAVSR